MTSRSSSFSSSTDSASEVGPLAFLRPTCTFSGSNSPLNRTPNDTPDIDILINGIARLLTPPLPLSSAASAAADTTRTVTILFPTSPRITELSNHDANFYKQYLAHIESLAPTPRDFLERIQCRCDKAIEQPNISKCRYPDMLPSETGLVTLQYTDDSTKTFINANWIAGTIATQGPLKNTVDDFLICLLEQQIPAVACLVAHKEPNRFNIEVEKTVPYWDPGLMPLNDADRLVQLTPIDEPKMIIHLADETDQYVLSRRFRITFGGTAHEFEHFHYVGWPDYSICHAPSLLALIKLMRQMDGGKRACHCSAGIGRTGVFVTLMKLIDQYEETKQVPTIADVCTAVVEGRKARPGLVLTPDQLKLICDTFILYL